jgi:tryptophanyl-tRNA synthetase
MKRILSGVQPSGKIHLGNYLGAIRQHIEMQKNFECYLFIADLHALTTVRDAEQMREYTLELAKSYIALGLDPKKTIFFQQSALPEHSELCWIFDTITHMGLLERAHAWKDALAKHTKDPSVGLFNYPVLQAADILLYRPDLVPVGQDQKQHVEITRDIAIKFNQTFGETFHLPEPFIKEDVAVVPGVDGQKMSKSYGNTIDIFADEPTLKKQVFSIKTDSTPLEQPKDPTKCLVFTIYSLLATKEESAELAKKYRKGGFGYGDSKKLLLQKILSHFAKARKLKSSLDKSPKKVQTILSSGNKKAKIMASRTLEEVKKKVGLI